VTRASVFLLVFAFGCGVGPFVTDVHIDGSDLVFERCTIRRVGGILVTTGCSTEHRALPGNHDTFTVKLSSLPTAGLLQGTENDHSDAGITDEIRNEVTACGARFHVVGNINVGLMVDYRARVFSVTLSSKGGALFANCIGTAFLTSRFPIWAQGARVEVLFVLPGTPPIRN
jgi:hypothetical protein